MKIVKDNIALSELQEMALKMHGEFVKAVVDVEKEIMAVEAEFHADLMEALIQTELCEPKNVWGINIFPDRVGDDFVMFDSMINLKPGLGNRTRGITDAKVREKIIILINKFVVK